MTRENCHIYSIIENMHLIILRSWTHLAFSTPSACQQSFSAFLSCGSWGNNKVWRMGGFSPPLPTPTGPPNSVCPVIMRKIFAGMGTPGTQGCTSFSKIQNFCYHFDKRYGECNCIDLSLHTGNRGFLFFGMESGN